jgi:hypothetical protein
LPYMLQKKKGKTNTVYTMPRNHMPKICKAVKRFIPFDSSFHTGTLRFSFV